MLLSSRSLAKGSAAAVGRMQAETADPSLAEGIEALGVKDTEQPAAGKEGEDDTERDTEMTSATEEADTAAPGEKGKNALHRS